MFCISCGIHCYLPRFLSHFGGCFHWAVLTKYLKPFTSEKAPTGEIQGLFRCKWRPLPSQNKNGVFRQNIALFNNTLCEVHRDRSRNAEQTNSADAKSRAADLNVPEARGRASGMASCAALYAFVFGAARLRNQTLERPGRLKKDMP